MRARSLAPAAFITACLAAPLLVTYAADQEPHPTPAAMTAPPTAPPQANPAIAAPKVPLRFVAPDRIGGHDGFVDARVRYFAHGSGHAVYFTPDQVVMAFVDGEHGTGGGLAIALAMIGADPGVRIEGRHRLRGRASYLIGGNPQEWRADLPTFGEIVYRAPWPGIDVVFRQEKGRLKWDLIVAPGARVGDVRFAYRGVESVSLDGAGDLRVQTARGVLTEPRPVSYQEIDGRRVPVSSRFVLGAASHRTAKTRASDRKPDRMVDHSDHSSGSPSDRISDHSFDSSSAGDGATEIGFEVGPYDPSLPLVIDPALVYSTFLGGANQDTATGVAVGTDGHIYVTGLTVSPTFPTKLGAFAVKNDAADVFVARVNPWEDDEDSLVYSTFLGGDNSDQGTAIALDAAGNAWVTGFTHSSDFPLTDGSAGTGAALDPDHDGAIDAFVVKLNASGSALLYSSFLGGSYDELAQEIVVRAAGPSTEIYIAGMTNSPDFPGAGTPPFNGGVLDPYYVDAFVAKLTLAADHSPAQAWATFVGGASNDAAYGLAVDATGHAFIAGDTGSTDFPVTAASAFDATYNGGTDAFAARLDTDGSCCLYATYLGGGGFDQASGVALDTAGHAYLTGRAGAGFPASAGAFDTSHNGGEDVFVARIDPAAVGAASRVYATLIGGAGNERGRAIAVAPSTGLAFVVGETSSATFPVTSGAMDSTLGAQDAYLVSVHPSGDALLYGTFLGALSNETAFAAALHPTNSDDLAVAGGGQTGFPTTASAYQTAYGGNTDAFVAWIQLAPQLCLGHLLRELDVLERPIPPTCLTCPPDPLRVAIRVLEQRVELARRMTERGNLKVARLTLARLHRDLDRMARRGQLPSAAARDLGLTVARCTQTLAVRFPRPS